MAEFARFWRDMPKIVYSRTLERAGWNTTVVREVVPEEVTRLKAQPGGDLVLGGADLGAAFRQFDLIAISLSLAATRVFANGVVLLDYERPGAGAQAGARA